jgi:ABC-type transport system substrate-binding protein
MFKGRNRATIKKIYKGLYHNRIIFSYAFFLLFALSFAFYKKIYQKTSTKIDQNLVIYWLAAEQPQLNPLYLGFKTNEEYLQELLYLPLVSFDQRGQIVYLLADRIQSENNYKTWKVHVRENIKTETGRSIEAKDIKNFFLRFQKENLSLRGDIFRKNLNQIDILNSQTLRFHLQTSDPDWLYQMTVGIKLESNEASGPLKLSQAKKNSFLFEVNPFFPFELINQPSPSWEFLEIIFFPEKLSLKIQAQITPPDLILPLKWNQKELITLSKSCPNYQTFSTKGLKTFLIAFNLNHPNTPSREFRQHFQCYLNKNPFMTSTFQDTERLKSFFFFPQWYLNLIGHEKVDVQKEFQKFCQDQTFSLKGSPPLNVSISSQLYSDSDLQTFAKKLPFPIKLQISERSGAFALLEYSKTPAAFISLKGIKTLGFLKKLLHSNQKPPRGINYTFSQEQNEALSNGSLAHLLHSVWKESAHIFLFHDEETIIRCKGQSTAKAFSDGRLWGIFG